MNTFFKYILDIDCFKPANGESITIKTKPVVQGSISVELLKNEKPNRKNLISIFFSVIFNLIIKTK